MYIRLIFIAIEKTFTSYNFFNGFSWRLSFLVGVVGVVQAPIRNCIESINDLDDSIVDINFGDFDNLVAFDNRNIAFNLFLAFFLFFESDLHLTFVF